MNSLRRLLRDLRKEVERITDAAPAGPGELDVSRLDDAELDRLEGLLARVGSQKPRREVRPRAEVLAGKENPATWERHWASNPGVEAPPVVAYVGRLNDEELRELEALLEKAAIPEAWEGEG